MYVYTRHRYIDTQKSEVAEGFFCLSPHFIYAFITHLQLFSMYINMKLCDRRLLKACRIWEIIFVFYFSVSIVNMMGLSFSLTLSPCMRVCTICARRKFIYN